MPKTILVVDDNRDFLHLMELTLRKEGYAVLLAESALKAAEMLQQTVPDAILLDIMMPARNGLEFLEDLRWDARYEKIPVIVVTAMLLSDEEREFVDEFSVMYLDKAKAPQIATHLRAVLGTD